MMTVMKCVTMMKKMMKTRIDDDLQGFYDGNTFILTSNDDPSGASLKAKVLKKEKNIIIKPE